MKSGLNGTGSKKSAFEPIGVTGLGRSTPNGLALGFRLSPISSLTSKGAKKGPNVMNMSRKGHLDNVDGQDLWKRHTLKALAVWSRTVLYRVTLNGHSTAAPRHFCV